jgi:hypothetical protein
MAASMCPRAVAAIACLCVQALHCSIVYAASTSTTIQCYERMLYLYMVTGTAVAYGMAAIAQLLL